MPKKKSDAAVASEIEVKKTVRATARKATVGELWPSRLTRVEEAYTKAEGERLTADDFEKKDVYINIRSIP